MGYVVVSVLVGTVLVVIYHGLDPLWIQLHYKSVPLALLELFQH